MRCRRSKFGVGEHLFWGEVLLDAVLRPDHSAISNAAQSTVGYPDCARSRIGPDDALAAQRARQMLRLLLLVEQRHRLAIEVAPYGGEPGSNAGDGGFGPTSSLRRRRCPRGSARRGSGCARPRQS